MGLLDRFFGPPSEVKFANLFMAAMRRRGEKRRVVYDQGQFRLTIPGDGGGNIYLHNAYTEYCSVPRSERAGTLSRFVRNSLIPEKIIPEDFQDASHDLLPTVRERSYFELAELMAQLDGRVLAGVPYQPLGDNLAIGLVYDLPEAMLSVGQPNLDTWGVTLYEALEVARENLGNLPQTFLGPQQDAEGIYLSATYDNYDACRLLLLDRIRRCRVKGDPVAMVPNRDTLIVTGADDADGIKIMLALAKDALQQPRPMSGVALRLDSDEWVSWLPPVSHPCYSEFRLMQIQNFAGYYAQQKELLDKLNEKKNQDIFVASFTVMQDKDIGTISSFCVWSKDCATLLPKTDKVAFFEKDKSLVTVDWDRLVEIVGSLMEPMGIYPERYRVVEYPSERQLKAMESGTKG